MMRLHSLLQVSVVFCLLAFCKQPDLEAEHKSFKRKKTAGFRKVDFIDNYDGDTFKVNLKTVRPLFGKDISIRIAGIDTAEIRSKNECEQTSAQQAKEFVRLRLSSAKKIHLKNCERGNFFRLVCDVFYDNKNLAAELYSNKLAVLYEGGSKQDVDWCRMGVQLLEKG